MEITELRHDKTGWQSAFSTSFAGAYNPRLELRSELSFNATPIAVLRMQYGAAFETVEVFGISEGKIKLLQHLEAGAFLWSSEGKDFETVLIALPSGQGTPATRYVWRKAQFQAVTP